MGGTADSKKLFRWDYVPILRGELWWLTQQKQHFGWFNCRKGHAGTLCLHDLVCKWIRPSVVSARWATKVSPSNCLYSMAQRANLGCIWWVLVLSQFMGEDLSGTPSGEILWQKCPSPQLGNKEKYTASWSGPIQKLPYWACFPGRKFSHIAQLRTLAWQRLRFPRK